MKRYSAAAKVNICLKITGSRGNYHELFSRFMRLEQLSDTLWFEPKAEKPFDIRGDFECTVEQNTIYKAYRALLEATKSRPLERFFETHRIVVEKRIPAFAGLGGGSSDAATFLHMCNETLNLSLSDNDLSAIGTKVGADVPFFVYGYPSANVSGIGEIVEAYDEAPLAISTKTPPIRISTPAVYTRYREAFYAPISQTEAKRLALMPSRAMLEHFSIEEANDLYRPACALYGELASHSAPGWFFSGSGSSFFKLQ